MNQILILLLLLVLFMSQQQSVEGLSLAPGYYSPSQTKRVVSDFWRGGKGRAWRGDRGRTWRSGRGRTWRGGRRPSITYRPSTTYVGRPYDSNIRVTTKGNRICAYLPTGTPRSVVNCVADGLRDRIGEGYNACSGYDSGYDSGYYV